MPRFIPGGAEQRAGRTKAAWRILLVCCLFAASPAELLAQGADTVRTFWFRARRFNIPFTIDPNDTRIANVLLHVSTDNGQTYRPVATARPADGRFFFEAPGDGWYFFIVQTRGQGNQLYPPDLRGVLPSSKICVDTQPPIINLQAVPPQDGSPAAIQWSIQDENFDDLRADYRSVNGGDWYPLILPRTATGRLDWAPVIRGDLEVRLQAIDKAKNQAAPQSVTVKQVAGRPGMAPADVNDSSDVKHVKNKTFQLEYQLDDSTVGPSDVAGVDIWMMRPGGPWQKYPEKGPRNGPKTIRVNESGRWGFRLIPRSGVGLADRDPRPGDPPDLWVEVDDRVPQVKVTNVVVGQGPDAGNLIISWTASDTFLRPRPIRILYAENPRGEWKKLTDDFIPNSGSYTCRPQELHLPFQFYLKVEASDQADNVGEDQWGQPVKVDLKVPRIKAVNVNVSAMPSQSSPQPQPDRSPPPPSSPAPVMPVAPTALPSWDRNK